MTLRLIVLIHSCSVRGVTPDHPRLGFLKPDGTFHSEHGTDADALLRWASGEGHTVIDERVSLADTLRSLGVA